MISRDRPAFLFAELTPELALAVRKAGQTFLDKMPKKEPSASLPLFATCDRPDLGWQWAAFVQMSLASERDLPVPVEVVSAPDQFVESPRPLKLPVRITGVGGSLVRHALESLEQQAWYLRESDVRDFALRVESRPQEDWRSMELGTVGEIVVISDDEVWRPWLRFAEDIARTPIVPRLIIILGYERFPYLLQWTGGYEFPKGVAVAFIPDRGMKAISEDLHRFIEEIVHDWPLHAAMHIFRKKQFSEELRDYENSDGRRSWALPHLYSDPASNQSLRFSSVLPEIIESASRFHSVAQAADVDRFSLAMERSVGPEKAQRIRGLLSSAQQLATSYRQAQAYTISFDRESNGLVPMARLAAATEGQNQIAQELSALIREPEIAEAFEHNQERKVDARLFHRTPEGSVVPLSGSEGLKPGMSLRLAIHIGQRADGSLVVGEAPALDPLLPTLEDDETHALDIVVFPKDFRLESAATQTVRLSRFGGTTPVEWDLVAPKVLRKPPTEETGKEDSDVLETSDGRGWVRRWRAELRFSVYRNNQLLQSFRLRAVLGNRKPFAGDRRVLIECDFSQTRRFGRLGEVRPRIISLAVNEDDSGGTHTLMLVKDGKSVALQWTETSMKAHTESVRQTLFGALSTAAKKSAFQFDPTTQKLLPPLLAANSYENAVRELADSGRALYVHLFLRNPSARGILKQVRESESQTLQLVRNDPDYAFPWALLYDYAIPEASDGSSVAVCNGGATCSCGYNPPGYCVRGFWGVRHIVEQLCQAPPHLDGEPGKIATAPTVPTVSVIPCVTDLFVKGLIAKIHEIKTPYEIHDPPPGKFLDSTRDKGKRPALVVFIGHMEEVTKSRRLSPRLVHAGNSLLTLDDIVVEIDTNGEWDTPRSLILLMACGSAASRVDTGTSLAAALLQLGAVGILGAECTVFTGMASRVAADVTRWLFQGSTMGDAMRMTVANLAAEGCPLGLAFTYLGSADAVLPT